MDLGRSAVKGVLVTSASDGIEILDADVVPLSGSPPKSGGEPSRDTRLWKAIQEFDNRHQIHKNPIAISIPAQNTLIREIQIALVGKRNVDELVEYEAANAIPFVLDEVFWDYHLFDETSDPTTRNGLLFAVKKNPIRTYIQAFSQIGADRIVEITMAPISGLNFLQYQMNDDSCRMLLDVGAENTNIGVTDGERFWMRNIMMGGNHITRMLRDTFDIPFGKAEEAKKNITRSKIAGQLVKAIKPGLHQLVAKIKTNLEYLDRTDLDLSCERIYAVGGSTRLAGMKGQLRQSLGQDLSNIRSLKNIFVSSKADSKFIKNNLDRLVVAIGTGITGLEESKLDASFLPESAARLARVSGTKRFLAVGSIFFWALLITLYVFAQRHDKTLNEALDTAEKVNQKYSQNVQRLSSAKNTSAVEQEIQWMKDLGEGRTQIPALVTDIATIFERASADGESIFGIAEIDSKRIKTRDSSDGEIILNIRGKMEIPPEAGPKDAYTWLKKRLLRRLQNHRPLARSFGSTQFSKNSKIITADDTQWTKHVHSGDLLTAIHRGETYPIEEVKSDTKLQLKRPVKRKSSQTDYIISRVDVTRWEKETLKFELKAEVPADNITVLAD